MAPEAHVDDIYEYLKTVVTLQGGHNMLWFRGTASPDYELVPGLIWRNQLSDERSYVHDFLVSYRAYVESVPDNPWDLWGLMQHHGIPTRLLDWTKSPLQALFFALMQEPDRDGERAVWILPPFALNKRTLGVESVFCPAGLQSRRIRTSKTRSVNLDAYLPQALDPADHYRLPRKPIAIEAPLTHRRIRGQLGCFTVHGSSEKPLDHYFGDNPEPPFVGKIVLRTKGKRESFLTPLLSWRIDEESIYQDLDSLAARLTREISTSSTRVSSD